MLFCSSNSNSAGVLPVPDDLEHTPDLLFWSGTGSVRPEAALESKTDKQLSFLHICKKNKKKPRKNKTKDIRKPFYFCVFE